VNQTETELSRRQVLLCYILMAAIWFPLYIATDWLTKNNVQIEATRRGIFYQWTVPQAQHIHQSLQEGKLSLTVDNHLFPMWGTAIFEALTDVGFLQNDRFLILKFTMICMLVVSNLLGTSVLKDRYGKRGLYLGGLLGLNPVCFQILGGTYDQFFFCPLFYCASFLLIKSEICTGHKWRWWLVTGLVLGIGANFRGDMTSALLVYLILRLRGTTRTAKCQLAACAFIFLLCLAPWAWLYYQRSGLLYWPGAGNGHLAYVSLGQGSDRAWGGGDFTPFGVVHLDAWDAKEMIRRVSERKPGYTISSPFGDPWASKVYMDMFVEKVSKRPYDYLRITLEKMRNIVFTFRPNPYLQLYPEYRWLGTQIPNYLTALMQGFHRITMLILLYFGICALVRGMRYPLFEIGGIFFLVQLTLFSLLQYHDRHLFALAGFQGMALVATIGSLYERWGNLRLKATQEPGFTVERLSPRKLLSRKSAMAVLPCAVPLLFFVFLRFQETFLGPYRRDLIFVDQIERWEAETRRMQPKTPWAKAGNYVFSSKGILVDLGKPSHAKQLEVSLNSENPYQISYLKIHAQDERETVATREIPKPAKISSGLAVHTVTVPQEAVERGYDAILIKPLGGNLHYSLGHLRLSE